MGLLVLTFTPMLVLTPVPLSLLPVLALSPVLREWLWVCHWSPQSPQSCCWSNCCFGLSERHWHWHWTLDLKHLRYIVKNDWNIKEYKTYLTWCPKITLGYIEKAKSGYDIRYLISLSENMKEYETYKFINITWHYYYCVCLLFAPMLLLILWMSFVHLSTTNKFQSS